MELKEPAGSLLISWRAPPLWNLEMGSSAATSISEICAPGSRERVDCGEKNEAD